MPAIKLLGMSGERPRIAPRLLPPSAAQSAFDVRLDNGVLTPYRKPAFEESPSGSGPFLTIYKHDTEWLAFANVVNAAPGPVAQDRLYYTGDGVPKMRVSGTVYNLAVPAPTAAPTVTIGGSGSGNVTTRIYVYTFVTGFGEESEPCPASNAVSWQSGNTVTISGIESPPSGRNITKQRFYRSQSGTVGTDFYFIAERAASNANFSDTVAVDDFAEPLPSRYWNPPPNDLAGLTSMPNGMMAGFVGKDLYFCEPYIPHAWPEKYVLTTDSPIVALASAGSLLWVLTEGVPYRVVGTHPSAMAMEKVRANLPCINPRGVADLGFAVAWTSNDGLAVGRPDGSVSIATFSIFSPREWQRLSPGTMRAGQVQGRWVASYDGTDETGQPAAGSLIVDLSGDSYLIRSSIRAEAWFYDVASGLTYFLDGDGNIQLFDAPTAAPALMYWKSKEFVLPRPDTFGAVLVETGGSSIEAAANRDAEIAAIIAENETLLSNPDGVLGDFAAATLAEILFAGDALLPVPSALGSIATINVYADGDLVATVGTLDGVARLPAGFTARTWEIDVSADVEILQITLARTVDELKQAAGAG